jgi:hypothetical protein
MTTKLLTAASFVVFSLLLSAFALAVDSDPVVMYWPLNNTYVGHSPYFMFDVFASGGNAVDSVTMTLDNGTPLTEGCYGYGAAQMCMWSFELNASTGDSIAAVITMNDSAGNENTVTYHYIADMDPPVIADNSQISGNAGIPNPVTLSWNVTDNYGTAAVDLWITDSAGKLVENAYNLSTVGGVYGTDGTYERIWDATGYGLEQNGTVENGLSVKTNAYYFHVTDAFDGLSSFSGYLDYYGNGTYEEGKLYFNGTKLAYIAPERYTYWPLNWSGGDAEPISGVSRFLPSNEFSDYYTHSNVSSTFVLYDVSDEVESANNPHLVKSALPDGNYTITAYAFDSANNIASSNLTVSVSNVSAPIEDDKPNPAILPSGISKYACNFANISWKTNVKTNATIRYGTDPENLSNSVSNSEESIEHYLMLEGLSTSTKYYYVIEACTSDACVVSNVRSFTTTEACALPPPQYHPPSGGGGGGGGGAAPMTTAPKNEVVPQNKTEPAVQPAPAEPAQQIKAPAETVEKPKGPTGGFAAGSGIIQTIWNFLQAIFVFFAGLFGSQR